MMLLGFFAGIIEGFQGDIGISLNETRPLSDIGSPHFLQFVAILRQLGQNPFDTSQPVAII